MRTPRFIQGSRPHRLWLCSASTCSFNQLQILGRSKKDGAGYFFMGIENGFCLINRAVRIKLELSDQVININDMKQTAEDCVDHSESDIDFQTNVSTHFSTSTAPSRKRKARKMKGSKSSKRTEKSLCLDYNILRFRTSHKTIRMYCFSDDALNFPYRFQKKLCHSQADNDIASDTDEIEARVQSGVHSLMEAIRDQHH